MKPKFCLSYVIFVSVHGAKKRDTRKRLKAPSWQTHKDKSNLKKIKLYFKARSLIT